MDDLERELRDAMHAAAEPPPAGLMAAVRRRHRRHRRRVGAGCVLAVAALALAAPPVTRALRAAPAGRPLVAPATAGVTPAATAAPGTVSSGCGSANPGQLGANWRTGARQAGPLWFVNGGHSSGKLRLYVVIAVITGVKPGSAVVVRTAPDGRPYLRFLFGPHDSLNYGTRYTLASGEAGVTFAACPPGSGLGGNSAPYTDYYGGILVSGQRCVPVQVWPPATAHPIKVTLGACPGWGSRTQRSRG